MSILEYRNVVKAYQSGPTEIRALNDVSLTIEPGEFVAVMGPSGCGKSTLLHLAGGLEAPTAGDIIFDGRSVTNQNPTALAE
ncbi:MAG TPA: ATP-binding cassette domain-containing protein, partial [Ilumatobacter sp.]|nr:ATP-binding cassette domain-containing protein [Ilumatobacter sp.]